MNDSEFLEQVAKIFEVNPSDLTLTTELKSLTTWNSMTFMFLARMLEEQFDQDIDLRRMLMCDTPQDLLDMLRAQ
ncbi:MAG: acyl carrier protein [Anaerobiospirillum sp.]|nr:acyl carrier protein [Anaerobiospirillum sp.]